MLRKTLSLTLALVMALSLSVTVFAGTKTADTVIEVEVDGTTVYIDLENYYDVVLPTAASLAFTLDPQGLTGIADKGTGELEKLTGGSIVGLLDENKKAIPAVMINYSALPVNVTMTYQGVCVAGGAAKDGPVATFLAADTDIDKGTTNNVFLTLAPSSKELTKADGTTYEAAAGKEFVVTGAEATANFVLSAAPYVITNTSGTYAAAIKQTDNVDEMGGSTGFVVGGKVSSVADWSAFAAADNPSKVELKTTFTFTKDTAEYKEADFVEGVVNLLAGPAYENPGFIVGTETKTAHSMPWSKTGEDLAVPFFFDSKTLKSVGWKSGTTLIPFTDAAANGNSIVLPVAFIASSTLGAKTVVITLSDNTTYTLTLTIAA